MSKDFPEELIQEFAQNNGSIFVGAGLSIGAGLPGWADLVRELAKELEAPIDADFLEVAQYYVNAFGKKRLVDKLRKFLDTGDPTTAHRIIAGLPVQKIFTTNLDNLLEAALDERKRPFRKVVNDEDVSFLTS